MLRLGLIFAVALCAVIGFGQMDAKADNTAYSDRTANRSLAEGDRNAWRVKRFWEKPKSEFRRGSYLKHDMPKQWTGKGWDYDILAQAGWDQERILNSLFNYGVFDTLYMKKDVPHVKLDKGFFNLGENDQIRSLDVLADYFDVFDKGHNKFNIYSPKHRAVIGYYSPKGLTLY